MSTKIFDTCNTCNRKNLEKFFIPLETLTRRGFHDVTNKLLKKIRRQKLFKTATRMLITIFAAPRFFCLFCETGETMKVQLISKVLYNL